MSEVMRLPNFKKMTINLMMGLFERKVLAESSVTGKSKEGQQMNTAEVILTNFEFCSKSDLLVTVMVP